MKKCSKCKQIKPKFEFHKCKSRADGLHAYCKECRNKLGKLYREQNIEKVRYISRRYHYRFSPPLYVLVVVLLYSLLNITVTESILRKNYGWKKYEEEFYDWTNGWNRR